jgi:hypothetical protein
MIYKLQGHYIQHIINCYFIQEGCAIRDVLSFIISYILLNALFLDPVSLRSCLLVRDEVSHLFNTADKIILLHVIYQVITVVSDRIILLGCDTT